MAGGSATWMDIDDGEGGIGDNQWVWVLQGAAQGEPLLPVSSLQCSVMDGLYGPALLTFELEIHIYCSFTLQRMLRLRAEHV